MSTKFGKIDMFRRWRIFFSMCCIRRMRAPNMVFGRLFPQNKCHARCGKTSQELLPLKEPYGSLNKE